MAQENSDGISEILVSLQTNNNDSDTLAPTLTLYTGERCIIPKPSINLQLSLGGCYNENPSPTPDIHQSVVADNLASFAVADNSSMVKRSYLKQNKMAQTDHEEIIIINNGQVVKEGKQKSKDKDPSSPDWAAKSASQNSALLRALKVIKSEGSLHRTPASSEADQCGTSDNSHAIHGVGSRPEIVFQAVEPEHSNTPHDFLSISPSNSAVNFLSMPSQEAANKELVASLMIPQPPLYISGVTANFELLPTENVAVPIQFPSANDKGKSVLVDQPLESATLFAPPINFYGTSDKGRSVMADQSAESAIPFVPPVNFYGTSDKEKLVMANQSSDSDTLFASPIKFYGTIDKGKSVMGDQSTESAVPFAHPVNFYGTIDKGKSVMVDQPLESAKLFAHPVNSFGSSDKGKSVSADKPSENATLFSNPVNFYNTINKRKSVVIDQLSESARLLAPPVNVYGTSANGINLMTNFSGRKPGRAAFATASSRARSIPYMPHGAIERENSATSGFLSNSQAATLRANPALPYMAASCSKEKGISDLMHYDPYLAPAANANSIPASGFASNTWTEVPIQMAPPLYGSTIRESSSNAVINPPEPARQHPLKRNQYLPDNEIDLMRNMPTVVTNGGIPDGRRIEGFLYRYNRVEDVVIVCICHGGFFSPTEFVMHAGGGEVENPMQLITIVP